MSRTWRSLRWVITTVISEKDSPPPVLLLGASPDEYEKEISVEVNKDICRITCE